MKEIYPEYKQGAIENLYASLSNKEKIILNDFLNICRMTNSVEREKKIKRIVLQFRDIIEKPLDKVTKKEVIGFLGIVNRSNREIWTKNDVKKIVKKFLKWYYKDFELVESPEVKAAFKTSSMLNSFNYGKINPRTLITPEELEKLLRAANNLKWKALISFLYESAFRPCEIRILKWKDIKFNDNTGFCEVSIISPKTKKQRTIIFRDSVIHLKRWREEYQFTNRTQEDFIFPSQFDRNKSLGDGVIYQMLSRLCKKANIRHLFPYLIRHSRITEIRKKGVDMQISSKFAGHSIEVDEIYSHLSNEDVKNSLLSQVYVTEELSQEKKDEYKARIEALEKQLREAPDKIIKLFVEEYLNKKNEPRRNN